MEALVRTTRLTLPGDLEKDVHTFLYYRNAESDAKAMKEGARDRLKSYLTARDEDGNFVNGEADANGNRILPITVGGRRVMAQRKVPAPYIDTDATAELLRARGGEDLYNTVFKTRVIREFDEDELFALHQKGVISDEELDGLEVQAAATYALVITVAPEDE